MKRYVLYPGFVTSQQDGDRHFIGSGKLRTLYLIPRDARVVYGGDPGVRPEPGDVECRPRFDGNYPVFE